MEPYYTFSNPVLPDLVDATAVGTNIVLLMTSGLEPQCTFSSQGLVDITTRDTDSLSTDICSSEAHYSFSEESVGSVICYCAYQTSDPLFSIATTEVATSHVTKDASEYVTGSVKTGHNRTSLNLQYKALNTLGAYLHNVEKIL